MTDIIIDDENHIDEKLILILAESIKETGLINPITISPDLRILAGRYRLSAVKKLGLKKIYCQIISLDKIDEEIMMLEENLLRKQLNLFFFFFYSIKKLF